jgi:hypothetical protein
MLFLYTLSCLNTVAIISFIIVYNDVNVKDPIDINIRQLPLYTGVNKSQTTLVNLNIITVAMYNRDLYDNFFLKTYQPATESESSNNTCLFKRANWGRYSKLAQYGQRDVVSRDNLTLNENICRIFIHKEYGLDLPSARAYWSGTDFLNCQGNRNFIGVYCQINPTQVLSKCLHWDNVTDDEYTCDQRPQTTPTCCDQLETYRLKYTDNRLYYAQKYPIDGNYYVFTDAHTGSINTTTGDDVSLISLGGIMTTNQSTCVFDYIKAGHFIQNQFNDTFTVISAMHNQSLTCMY